MPELPEVETVRRQIEPYLVGRQIGRVQTTGDSYFFLTPPQRLRGGLNGKRVVGLTRRGKYLLADLSGGGRLLVHLGMTGQLIAGGAASARLGTGSSRGGGDGLGPSRFKPDAHTHLRIGFRDGGPRVFLRDVRKFGKVLLLENGQTHPRLVKLGVDALEVTGDGLFRAARRRRISIKALLLDQSVLAGVGNIYADEALFLAGVRPLCVSVKITRGRCQRIAEKLRWVLERSIALGGASVSDFLAPDGSDGAYQNQCHVYGRSGRPCRACQTPIERCVVTGRSTHYCPRCQR